MYVIYWDFLHIPDFGIVRNIMKHKKWKLSTCFIMNMKGENPLNFLLHLDGRCFSTLRSCFLWCLFSTVLFNKITITNFTGYLFSVLSFKSQSSLIVQFGRGCEMGTGCTLGLCFFLRLWGFQQGTVMSKFSFVWVSVKGHLLWIFFLSYFYALTQQNTQSAALFCEIDEKLCWSQLRPGCCQLCCLKRGYNLKRLVVLNISEPIQWILDH